MNCLFEWSSSVSEGGFVPSRKEVKDASKLYIWPGVFLTGDLLTPLVADPLVPAGMCVEDDLY